MTTEPTDTLHTEGIVSDYFTIEGHLLSTRSADAYKAIDSSRNEPVCLWMMRHPLAIDSPSVKRFLSRMETLDQIEPALSEMTAYGVDAEGTAFAVFPVLDGHAVGSGNLEAKEAERRFVSSIRFIERMHNSGIVCGDICESSLWVDRAGDISFIGVMGSFDAEAVATAMLPPADTLPYLAPEQRTGGAVEPASDVFSLGILGYYLFTGTYPFGEGAELMMADFDVSQVSPLSRYVNIPPVWADEVLRRCLDPDPEERYQSAASVVKAINEIRKRALSQEKAPVRVSKGTLVSAQKDRPSGSTMSTSPIPTVQPAQKVPMIPEEEPKRNKVKVAGVLLLLGVFLILVFLKVFRSPEIEAPTTPELEGRDVAFPEGAGNPEISDAANQISRGKGVSPEVVKQVGRLRDSDDPLAHHILVQNAQDATSDEMRQLIESAIVDRARRKNYIRSAEQVRQWLRTVRSRQAPAGYEAILKSIDSSLPIEDRAALLREAYPEHPPVIVRLAAALAFDSGDPGQYQPILAQLIGDALSLEDSSQYSAVALILAHEDLATVFGDDILQHRETLTNVDIPWALEIIAARNDSNTRAIANLGLERGLITPIRRVFLELIRDRSDLDPPVLTALIRFSGGIYKSEDLSVFGRWYDTESQNVLLAILADAEESAILEEAFDLVAGKSVTIEPALSLLDWVRSNYWAERVEFAHAVGVFAFLDLAGEEMLKEAFEPFDKFVGGSDLIYILLETNNPIIMKLTIERYGNTVIDLGQKLNLLRNPDREVRLAAIGAIDTNEMGAYKIIKDRYQEERDPEIRKVYEEKFWFISEGKR